jgi:hypothetical protein
VCVCVCGGIRLPDRVHAWTEWESDWLIICDFHRNYVMLALEVDDAVSVKWPHYGRDVLQTSHTEQDSPSMVTQRGYPLIHI